MRTFGLGVFVFAMSVSLPARAVDAVPEDFVDVRTLAAGIVVDARYAGADNFLGRPAEGYEAARCLLTRPAAEALARVHEALAPRGLGLKVYDCYRPARAVADFVRWAADASDVGTKATYYPDLDKKDLIPEGYIAEKSGHSRGSTVDLTLIEVASGADLDMGTPFDFFSERSRPDDAAQSETARRNRATLAEAMRGQGFVPYPSEWWHFTLAAEPYPDRYFDFPIR